MNINITGEMIADALRRSGMEVQYFPLRLAAENRKPHTCGSESLNKIADALNAHMAIHQKQTPDEYLAVVEKARDMHESEGTLEIDSAPLVSIGEDGAYVQAWVFVPNSELAAAGFDNPEAKGHIGG